MDVEVELWTWTCGRGVDGDGADVDVCGVSWLVPSTDSVCPQKTPRHESPGAAAGAAAGGLFSEPVM